MLYSKVKRLTLCFLLLCSCLTLKAEASASSTLDESALRTLPMSLANSSDYIEQFVSLTNYNIGLLVKENNIRSYRIMDQDGNEIAEVPLSTILGARLNNVSTISVYPLSDGRTLMTWEGTNNGCDNNTNNMFQFSILGADGSILKTATNISTVTASYNCYTGAAELSNGNIAIYWQTSGDNYLLRIFDSQGNALTNPTSIDKTGTREGNPAYNSSYSHSIAAGEDGFLITYNFYNNNYYYGVFYNNDGTQKLTNGFNQIRVASASSSGNMYSDVTSLPNGNYALTYRSGPKLAVKIIDETGQQVGTELSDFSYSDEAYPWVYPLDDGGILVTDGVYVYDEDYTEVLSGKVYAKEYDQSGNLLKDWTLLTDQGTGWPISFKGREQGFGFYNDVTDQLDLYNFKRSSASASTNASLMGLTTSVGVLSPEFQTDQTQYTVDVENNEQEITITPVTSDANATVLVNGQSPSAAVPLSVGANTITVTVTAEDGETTESYVITVTRHLIKGDGNGDGKVTSADALLVYQAIAGKVTLTNLQKKALDMDSDGDVDNVDAGLVMKKASGK